MKLKKKVKQAIIDEFNNFKDNMYSNKSIEERKELDQFFTPPELTIAMIEMFECTEEELPNKKILDPTCGSGNLLVACLIAGANIKNLYGNDYDSKMVEICRQRLLKVSVGLKNTSTIDLNNIEEELTYHIHRGNALQKLCLTEFSKEYNDKYDEDLIDDLEYAQNSLKQVNKLWD